MDERLAAMAGCGRAGTRTASPAELRTLISREIGPADASQGRRDGLHGGCGTR